MKLLTRPIALIKDSRRAYLALNAATFGVFIVGLVVGTIWPRAARGANDLIEVLAGVSPASDSVYSAVDGGRVWLLAAIILVANIAFGGLLMAVLPSLLVPFAGIVIHITFAALLGLTYAPVDGWGLLLPHLPTLVIELSAYVLFMLGVYRLGTGVLVPRLRGFPSRAAGYRQGLVDIAWLCIPAVLLLVVGAVYEAFEVIALLT
ncbi:hypothetical protein [Promicromonospora sukumoe]|uniref:hypothetical protein n=1 Tax=Promicromonospora sukumoe TaxID=88382 RepID=UPI00364E37A2